MADKYRTIHVHPALEIEGLWIVREHNKDNPIVKRYDKKEAIAFAKTLSKNGDIRLVIHAKNGAVAQVQLIKRAVN